MYYYDSLTGPRIAFVRNALTAVGATFPKAVTKAMAERDQINAAARDYIPATRDQINAAVTECFLNGRDPAEDEHVRHLVMSNALVGEFDLSQPVKMHAEHRIVEAIAEHADDILTMLAGPTEEAGRKLTESHAKNGEESDPAVIIGKGVDAVEAWTHAQRAVDLLRTIDKAWVALAHLTGFANPELDPVLRLADVNVETFDKAGRKATPWDIVRAGGTISLADRTTAPERARRVLEQSERRQAETDGAYAAAYRRMHGVGAA